MEHKHVRSWTAALLFTAWMLILAFLSPVVPVLPLVGGLILLFYLPVLSLQYNLSLSIGMAVLSVAALAFFEGPLAAVQWTISAVMGCAVGAGYCHQVRPLRILLGVSGAVIVLGALACAAVVMVSHVSLYAMIQQTVSQLVDDIVAYYLQNNPGSPQIIEIHQQMKMLKETIPALIPVQLCLSVLIMTYLQLRLTQFFLARTGHGVTAFMPVRLWEMPRLMLYVYVLSMVMKYWGVSRGIFWLNLLSVNLEQFASFFICVQGISFTLYLLHRRFVLRSATQALIILVVLVVPAAQIAAFFLGLGDMLFNYRKKKEAL